MCVCVRGGGRGGGGGGGGKKKKKKRRWEDNKNVNVVPQSWVLGVVVCLPVGF